GNSTRTEVISRTDSLPNHPLPCLSHCAQSRKVRGTMIGMDRASELTTFLRSLRSVRRFSSRSIGGAVLLNILEVARWTGSSKNTQPWHLVVIREASTLATLATCGPFAGHLAGANAAIVLVMDDSNRRFDEGRLAQNVMLAAWAH